METIGALRLTGEKVSHAGEKPADARESAEKGGAARKRKNMWG